MKALACVFATSLCLAALPSSAALPPDAAFVTMDGLASQIQPVHDVIAAAAEAGGHAYHVMPVHTPEPDRDVTACCLIASIPPGQEPAILGMPFVTGLYRPGEPIITQPPGEEAEFAAGAWMYLLDEEIPTTPEAEPFPDDALGPLEGGGMPTAKAQQRPQAPPPVGAPGQYQTSEFMIGSVTIGVVLPESTGNGENWSNSDPLYPGQNRQQLVYNKIVAGANFWVTSAADLGEPDVLLRSAAGHLHHL